ncbi:MAG: TerB family tellurite resistance protein [Cyclobacteriaceae bacterium]|nr:MAG: TerB family tellurite resistance protein [Cyclobacteriaceae bacterium]
MTSSYHLGILNLTHLLISADGIIDDQEKQALTRLRKLEQIDDAVFETFSQAVQSKKERDIYKEGIDNINACTDEEKLRALALLYKMSEVDGRVHAKEVRLLLYSIKLTGIEFDDVVKKAGTIQSLF